ncbi:hypothetical protein [Nonomuraea sp. KM90]|uniref:hypothetical protein n=1 Tax=Nonomuraea sp. KM90 TaxID=3457428 RepID=UPI003FCD47C3
MPLAPGVSIFELGDATVLRTPDGEFLAVNAELDADLDRLAPPLAEAFTRAGFLVPGSSHPPASVIVLGEGMIAAALADLLPRTGLTLLTPERPHAGDRHRPVPGPASAPPTTKHAPAPPGPEPAVAWHIAEGVMAWGDSGGGAEGASPGSIASRLVADGAIPAGGRTVVSWVCDGLPPAAAWAALDAEVGRVARQRCSVEGATAVIEPIAVAGGDVTHTHVRQRRLAASDSPDHLAAYWAGPPIHAASAIDPVAAAFVAALLAADLLAWAAGRPHGRRLRLADLRTQRVSDHPILPVPSHHPRTEKP